MSLVRATNLLAILLPMSWCHASTDTRPGSMEVSWNPGASDCERQPQPAIQTHEYNTTSYVLRENLCAHVAAPFMYLLIGTQQALLIDTGAVSDAALAPLATTVQALLARQSPRRALIVVHTADDAIHKAGDSQFSGMSGVEIVASGDASVRSRFNFKDWPNGTRKIDLGNRIVDVLPTPGTHETHVAYYDRQTALFFSGDFLFPGRLKVDDSVTYLASARRVAEFAKSHKIAYVLGSHIEMDTNGKLLAMPTSHPDEHALQLTASDLLALPAHLQAFNGVYNRHDQYVLTSQSRVMALYILCAVMILAALEWYVRAWSKQGIKPESPETT
jgi:hydroxyacylglutathione hydrolase